MRGKKQIIIDVIVLITIILLVTLGYYFNYPIFEYGFLSLSIYFTIRIVFNIYINKIEVNIEHKGDIVEGDKAGRDINKPEIGGSVSGQQIMGDYHDHRTYNYYVTDPNQLQTGSTPISYLTSKDEE